MSGAPSTFLGSSGTCRKRRFSGPCPVLALYMPDSLLSCPSAGAGAFCLKAKMRALSTPIVAASCRLYSSLASLAAAVDAEPASPLPPSALSFSFIRDRCAASTSMAERAQMKRSICVARLFGGLFVDPVAGASSTHAPESCLSLHPPKR
eukprot:30953-Chlamydomonas_euryale.AAC.7